MFITISVEYLIVLLIVFSVTKLVLLPILLIWRWSFSSLVATLLSSPSSKKIKDKKKKKGYRVTYQPCQALRTWNPLYLNVCYVCVCNAGNVQTVTAKGEREKREKGKEEKKKKFFTLKKKKKKNSQNFFCLESTVRDSVCGTNTDHVWKKTK